MIETLMALWNRGVRGRLLVMIVTFFCLCISISLLFVTVGSIWGPQLTHGRPHDEATTVSDAGAITATAPPSGATAPVVVTPTLPPNLCLASPTGARGKIARADATRNHRKSGLPTRTATSGPLHRPPTPGASPTLSPTLPAVTPTVPLTPTVTAQPTITPTVTNTPGNTPTAVVTPTGTSTPGATPTVPVSTPTVGLAPTGTDTSTATATGTVTPVTPPTVTGTAPAGSPTVVVSATSGMAGRQVHDGRPQVPGTPINANNGQPGQGNCLGDTLVTSGEANLLARLQDFFWIILVSSLLGTTLFCAQIYRLSRRAYR